MKTLRLFFFCVLALVLPVNTVLAQMPTHAKSAAQHLHSVHTAQHMQQSASEAHPDHLHIHQGLFGKTSVHVHEAAVKTDCIKACQAMTGSLLVAEAFLAPLPHAAILVAASAHERASITLDPLEDPPRLRA